MVKLLSALTGIAALLLFSAGVIGGSRPAFGQAAQPTATPPPPPTQTAAPTQAATPTPPPTPSPTPSPAATATAAATRTATPVPTRAPTQVPQDVAEKLAPDCPAQHNDGPRQLTPRQPTRIEVICRVTNPLNEMVDYAATMVFTLGDEAAVVGGSAQRGQVAVVGKEIRWSGFALAPGESATASAVVEVTPAGGDVGQPVVVFVSTRTTAQVASGGFVNLVTGPVTTADVSGLLGGGFVLAPPGPAPAGAPAQPAPAAAAPRPAAALPRTGAGPGEAASVPWTVLVVMVAGAGVIALGTGAAARHRRQR